MRRALAIVAALLLAVLVQAGSTVVVIKKPSGAPPSHPADVLLWTNWEVGVTTGVYTQHATNEFAVSDREWTDVSLAEVSADGAYVGSLGMETTSSGDTYGNEINATDECLGVDNPWDCCTGGTGVSGGGTGTGCENVSPSEGNIGFWFQATTIWNANTRFMRVKTGNADEFACALSGTSGISCTWEVTSNTTRTVSSGDVGLTLGVWYHVQYIYDEAAPLIRLIVKSTTGTELINVAHTVGDFPPQAFNTTTGLLFGTVEGAVATSGILVDQVIVSNDSTRDIYTDWAATATINYP